MFTYTQACCCPNAIYHAKNTFTHAQTPDRLKTSTAEEAFSKNGLSQRTIRLLKDAFPDLEVGMVTRSFGGPVAKHGVSSNV